MFGWALALIVAIIMAVVLHSRLSESEKKTVEFSAALVSAAGVVYTILLTVQSKRASNAARFAERWNDPEFTERRREVTQIINGEKHPGETTTRNLVVVLNFFEEMSIVVQFGEADERVLKKFFRSPAMGAYAALQPWIEEQQAYRKQPTLFKEFILLAKNWTEET